MQSKPKLIRVLPSLNMTFSAADTWDEPEDSFTYAINMKGSGLLSPWPPATPPTRKLPAPPPLSRELFSRHMANAGFTIAKGPGSPDKSHIIAAWMASSVNPKPGKDVLYGRHDADGALSIKPGPGGSPTRVDEYEQIMTDARKARFKQFDVFIGYYKIPKRGVLLPTPEPPR